MTPPSNHPNEPLRQTFLAVSALIRTAPAVDGDGGAIAVPDRVKLKLYGYYKVATSSLPRGPRPSLFDPVGRAKYDACEAARAECHTVDDAMRNYLKVAADQQDNGSWVGLECARLYREWQEEGEEPPHEWQERIESKSQQPCTSAVVVAPSLLVSSSFLPAPLLTRGQLDISFVDLLYGLYHCLHSILYLSFVNKVMYPILPSYLMTWMDLLVLRSLHPAQRGRYLEHQIETSMLEKGNEPVTTTIAIGLSVRSLLDLYLSTRCYPSGSEVVIVPGMTIPGMVDVMTYHDLILRPMDLPEKSNATDEKCTLWDIDIDAIKTVLSKRTVAIVVVHPFGAHIADDTRMKQLRLVADEHSVEIWEDCAQCFTGDSIGSQYADLTFLSFGPIKTSTALGGGLAVLRSRDSQTTEMMDCVATMKRIQESTYQQQSNFAFVQRLVKCLILHTMSYSPMCCGAIKAVIEFIGWDYNEVVVSSLRGFSAKSGAKHLIKQLRQRPCTALLALLYRRLKHSKVTMQTCHARKQRCCAFEKRLLDELNDDPNITIPRHTNGSGMHGWIFPLLVKNPQQLSSALLDIGIDAPCGLTQLSPVNSTCPRISAVFEQILYLPVTNNNFSFKDENRLIKALKEHTQTKHLKDVIKKQGLQMNRHYPITILVSVLFHQYYVGQPYWSLKQMIEISLRFIHLATLTGLCVLLLVVSLSQYMGPIYLESSNAFAKYCDMLFKSPFHGESNNSATCTEFHQTEKVLELESTKIPQIPSNRGESQMCLVTGVTGFIGSLLLRELLLHRRSLGIGGVVVIVRARRGKSASDRITDLLSQDMFAFLRDDEKSSLIHVMDGDVTLPDCGLTQQQVSFIGGLNISNVFHCAAAVSFQQPLEQAALSNITSSLQMQKLTQNVGNKNAKFIYISTAFVHGGKTGTKLEPLPESLFSLEPYDPLELYKSMLGTQSYASAAMIELGFPNTYTFSKCICEHLLHIDQNVDTVIVRPSIVGPSVQEPYEGWAGEKPSTIVAAACLYLKFPYNMWCFGKERVPFVPADVVCRFVVSKAFEKCVAQSDGYKNTTFIEEKKEVEDITTSSKYNNSLSISTVAWDASSSANSSFSWVNYAFAITHLGCVCGHVNRVVAYAGLLFSTKLFPWFNFQYTTFHRLHSLIVRAPIDAVLSLCERFYSKSTFARNMKTLSPLLDLPMLFFPFANQKFYFKSDLVAPSDFDGERYMFSCAVAAHRFILQIEKQRSGQSESNRTNIQMCPQSGASVMIVAGAQNCKPASDLLWAFTQPKGNFFIRLAGWSLAKVFRYTTNQIEVDASSFVELSRTLSMSSSGSKPHVIIAPTHRSFYDFLIISYICFSYPELGVDIPFIAAADDFREIPIVGWLARGAGAFFLKRGGNRIDPGLKCKLNRITHTKCTSSSIEVFIEGTRSRYRTFSQPKTGFLRCLAETGQKFIILPITINYEALPDQTSLLQYANHGSGSAFSLKNLMLWLHQAYLGNFDIGRVHVSASGVLDMPESATVGTLCKKIQHLQQSRILVSDFHLQAASSVLSIPMKDIREALEDLHINVWPVFGKRLGSIAPSQSRDLQWIVMLHFAYAFAPFFASSHPTWASWLFPSHAEIKTQDNPNNAIGVIVRKLTDHFDAVDAAVKKVINDLHSNGFVNPNETHIIQYLPDIAKANVPMFLFRAAIQTNFSSSSIKKKSMMRILHNISSTKLLYNPIGSSRDRNSESLGAWGYDDSYFVLNVAPNGSKYVVMKGDRYGISGKKLPELATFVENQLNIKINPNDPTFPTFEKLNIDPNIDVKEALSEIANIFRDGKSQISFKPYERARHGTGHTQEDMYRLRSGSLRFRLPDLVVWPKSVDEVEALVSIATTRKLCLIPFGGGTNVTHATHCPEQSNDPRPMISVDMKRLNKVIWVNKEDGLAHVEAGITGRELIEQMKKLDLTIGHEPDSYEFSTLGGWIATKASGMKQNKYGNIEDIVKEVTVVGSSGVISNMHVAEKISFGRVSTGVDFKSIVLGSEGCLGIIVSAIIKVWPIAESISHESVLLPNFDAGLRFVKAISKMHAMKPASVRLLDNEQFRLGQALKPEASGLQRIKSIISKQVGFFCGDLSETSVVCATITFEGSILEVQMQKKIIRDIAASHSGILAGASVGKAGYDLTFAIAYLRDFALNYNILGESFETFVPWSKLKRVIEKVKQRIQLEHRTRSLPGEPFVCCRITQLYDEGACVYFYFCMNIKDVKDPSKTFATIEECARQEILDAGGSLSHHHGLGKLRAPFIHQIYSNEYVNSIIAVKNALDPNNVFGARNGVLYNNGK